MAVTSRPREALTNADIFGDSLVPMFLTWLSPGQRVSLGNGIYSIGLRNEWSRTYSLAFASRITG